MKGTLLLLFFVLSTSCGKEPAKKSSQTYQDISSYYNAGKLNISVYYEEGAEPYTDKVGSIELWSLLRSNLDALFEGRSTEIAVPGSLENMTKMTAQKKASWSLEDVMALARAHPISNIKGVTDFQIFFLNGYANNNPGIIGFHISNTRIMAIFKDVIKSTANGNDSTVPKYVEQATLIHEMGHALGLVNNGLPMKQHHQDTEHGAHCDNSECVMYYSNEGTSSMMKFALNASKKLSPVMFDTKCLNDSRNYKK